MATIKATKPSQAPEVQKPTDEPKKERVKYQEVFPSAKDAEEAAAAREKGPRRAFTVKFGGKDVHVVANNEGRAMGAALAHLGGTVQELGKKPSTRGPVGPDAIMAALNALPEADRAAVLAQIKGAK